MNRYDVIRFDAAGVQLPAIADREHGKWLLRAEVIEALAQLPRSAWPTDGVLAALGIERRELAAIDGAREGT